MRQLEEMILTLIIGPSIANARNAQLSILNAIVFGAAFSQSSTVGANNGRVSKVGVDAIKSRSIGDRDIDLITPCHSLADLHLLIAARIHVLLIGENRTI
jgi:hypothetical protein